MKKEAFLNELRSRLSGLPHGDLEDRISFYAEMIDARIEDGMSEEDAIIFFGQQCMVPQIKKFASTIITSLKRGPEDLAQMLMQQSKEVWAMKQQIMRRRGEAANAKLLFPIVLTFIGILIMVIVPIFSNMGA